VPTLTTYSNVVGPIQPATIFVAYPYSFPEDDYRDVFTAVSDEMGGAVRFVFADEKLTKEHILVKIRALMEEAAFSLFDITLWNPNVALELGIAYGLGLDYYILFDPSKGDEEVLSDVRGIDRIQYKSYGQLRTQLSKLVRGQFGAPEAERPRREHGDLAAQLEAARLRIPRVLRDDPGKLIGGLADSIGVDVEVTQALVSPLIGAEVETRGTRRGTRFYAMGDAPRDEMLSAHEVATRVSRAADILLAPIPGPREDLNFIVYEKLREVVGLLKAAGPLLEGGPLMVDHGLDFVQEASDALGLTVVFVPEMPEDVLRARIQTLQILDTVNQAAIE
jgi:hypothetical protein